MASSQEKTTPALPALLKNGALTGQWVLDPLSSSVALKSRIMGLIPVSGVFGEVSGTAIVSPEGKVSGSLTVAASSIVTKNKKRDKHLRSADFFDSDNYPDITFTVDSVRTTDIVTIMGALTVRDRIGSLSFDAAISVPGNAEVWLDAGVHINRADFGVTWNQLGLVSLKNILTIHAVFNRR
jgi:polyisoprenoid-binding protein YceI